MSIYKDKKVMSLKHSIAGVINLIPRNKEQKFAIEALLQRFRVVWPSFAHCKIYVVFAPKLGFDNRFHVECFKELKNILKLIEKKINLLSYGQGTCLYALASYFPSCRLTSI